MMEYKNVLFDLGNVLINVDVKRSLKAFAALMQLPDAGQMPSSVSEMVSADSLLGGHTSKVVDQYQIGAITTEQFISAFLAQCKPDTQPEQLIDAWYAMLLGIPAEKKDLLNNLVERGKNIYVLSNNNDLHVQWVQKHCPELQVAKRIFYSNEIHMSKPDPRCYELVIRETGILPEETVYVDDLLPNIESARKFGFQCIHATDNSWMGQL